MSAPIVNLLLFPEPKNVQDQALEIYQLYPRKVGRPKALESIRKALRHHPYVTVLEGTRKFAALWEGADDYQFCPHPATFFNQQRYADEPETWNRPHSLKVDKKIPDWRVAELLQEELRELNNELQYDFDLIKKPAMVERRKTVRAQLQALQQKFKRE